MARAGGWEIVTVSRIVCLLGAGRTPVIAHPPVILPINASYAAM